MWSPLSQEVCTECLLPSICQYRICQRCSGAHVTTRLLTVEPLTARQPAFNNCSAAGRFRERAAHRYEGREQREVCGGDAKGGC